MGVTALQKAQARLKELRESGELKAPEYLDPMEKARRNPKSTRAAINAKCWDCVGAGADPSPRWVIGNCTSPGCPLYALRPHQAYKGKSTPSAWQEIASSDL